MRGFPSARLYWWLLCALVLCFSVLVVGHGYAAASAAYKLGSGDKLRVTVFGEKDLSGDFFVSDQGVVSLPLIGPVQLAGKTIDQAEAIVAQRYNKNYLVNPRVSIEVLNYRPFYILGEVVKPGSYPYVAGLTVLNAVALAGGYTPRADRDDIKIRRAANPKAGEQDIGENGVVLPGDVVRVPERFF